MNIHLVGVPAVRNTLADLVVRAKKHETVRLMHFNRPWSGKGGCLSSATVLMRKRSLRSPDEYPLSTAVRTPGRCPG